MEQPMKHKAFILIALVSLTLGSCGALEDNTATGSLTLTVTGATPNRPYRARLLHHTSLYSGYKKTGNTTASGGISTTYSGVPIGDATLFIDKAPANFLPDYSIEYAGSFYFVNSSTPYEFNLNEEFVQ